MAIAPAPYTDHITIWALHLQCVCYSAILHQPVIPVEEPVSCTTQVDLDTGTLMLHISLFQLKPQTDLFWLKAIIRCSLSGESILATASPNHSGSIASSKTDS